MAPSTLKMIHPTNRAERLRINAEKKQKYTHRSGIKAKVKDQESQDELTSYRDPGHFGSGETGA